MAKGDSIKASELLNLLNEYGIKLGEKNVARFAKQYGIKNDPNKPKSSGFYIEPLNLKEIKEKADANRLKAPVTIEAIKALEERRARAIELFKTGDTIPEVRKKIKNQFGFDMGSTLNKIAKELGNVPSASGSEGTAVKKVREDLIKLNKSEVKNLIRTGKADLVELVKKSQKILNTTPEIAARRLGQLIEAFDEDKRYISVKSDFFVKKAKPLIEGLGKLSGTSLYGGIGGGIQRMLAEKKVSSSINKPSTFFTGLRKRIQELIPSKNIEVDEIKNLASSGRFGTGPYSIFLQGVRSNINQEKARTLDKKMGVFEKKNTKSYRYK